ncbi:peptide/nickel transport system substrate-binding protein [Streptomyces sp. 1114.5]|uniref:ABC transporter substrate-binding protein n=1 Tax=unclassified Streptomyces TaxID=2593676 RepID=UPI000BC8EFD7|nr:MULTISPECIES: ABC transporter substrate-binding protein [unclassified Streptomyces]RKT15817.1 peptide/nickel transport system substrate-binding protein [Streptomyces sp. 1114.5]SOB81992.1 peptide/nickel transport system substrate-binding protein [Streptomyces sp. 1331.2]
MRRSRTVALTAMAAAAVLVVTGCNSSTKNADTSSSSSASGGGGANAATKNIVNASDKKGGTVTFEMKGTPDSLDPGNTYYAYIYNFSRLYARPLTTFNPAAGEDGNKLVPDLAESMGQPSADGLTWTYKLRAGLKYDDGTPITSKDVKYAVERSNFAPDVNSNGPTYFHDLLVDNDTPYAGPYKDKAGGLNSIETPDDTTIVFHLKHPFADFDYLVSAPQTAPVPQAKDTGADYVKHIVSSGAFKFESYEDGKQAVLVPNTNWDKSTDPIRKQLPDKILLKMNIDQATIDKDLLAGNAQVDLVGGGVDPQTQAQILQNPKLKANTDNAYGGRLVYLAINSKVAPFDNVDCRKAVQFAIDKVSVQTAEGGPIRGQIANTVLPPDIPGHQDFNLFETKDNKGDEAKAKDALKACGKDSINTVISARTERATEVAAATSIQAALKKVGINAEIQQYPQGKYLTDSAGAPQFTQDHNIGLMMMQWGADWPTGYGFLQQVVDGRAIKASGNSNLSQLNDPAVNKLIDDAAVNPDKAAREKIYADIDKKVMEQAVIVPLTYFKVFLYRPDNATNIASNPAFSGEYDSLNIGTTK